MMLMRENMKHSMLQTISTSSSLDLSTNSKSRTRTTTEGGGFVCGDCGRTYKLKSSLRNHQKWECGKEPQFKCPYCSYKAKQKMHMARHLERMHREIDLSINREIKNEPVEDETGKEVSCSAVKGAKAKASQDDVQDAEDKQLPEGLTQDLSCSQD